MMESVYSKSDKKGIKINDEAGEAFDSLKNRDQNNVELMKGSEFVFDYVHILYYKYRKKNLNRSGLYIDSLDWIKNKKATLNSINKENNKCFQCVVKVALHHAEIKKDPQKITKCFIC